MASAYATLAASGVYHRAALRAEGGQRRGPGAVRRGHRGQLRRAAHRQGRRRQRDRRHAADRRVLQRPRPGGRAPVGGQDGHQPARRHRRQPGRLDGRVHAVAVDRGVGRHHRGHPAAGEQVGRRRCTARACRPTSGRPRWTARSRAPTRSRSRSRREIGGYAGVPPAAAAAAAARRPPPPSETVIQPTIEVAPGITIPFGPPTTVPVARRSAGAGSGAAGVPAAPAVPAAPGGPAPGRSRPAAAVTESGDPESNTGRRTAAPHRVSPQPLADDRAQRRRPRPAQQHRRSGRRAVGGDRRAGRQARVDRPARDSSPRCG